MDRRTVGIGGAALLAAIIVAMFAILSGDEPAADATPANSSALTVAAAQATTLVARTTTLAVPAISPSTTFAPRCTFTDEPHIFATGVVTTVDAAPIAPQGETAEAWFSLGNAVSITVRKAGGPAVITLVAALSSDSGDFRTFNVGHDSRGAYPPPDTRAPANYLAFDAATNGLVGTVGLSIETLEAGEAITIEPAEFSQSNLVASLDERTGTISGALTHPDVVIEFLADQIVMGPAPVYSSPECFLDAMETIRAADNPAP